MCKRACYKQPFACEECTLGLYIYTYSYTLMGFDVRCVCGCVSIMMMREKNALKIHNDMRILRILH